LLRADGRNQHKKARARVVAAMKECDRDYPDDRAAHATCLKEIPGYKEHRVRPKFRTEVHKKHLRRLFVEALTDHTNVAEEEAKKECLKGSDLENWKLTTTVTKYNLMVPQTQLHDMKISARVCVKMLIQHANLTSPDAAERCRDKKSHTKEHLKDVGTNIQSVDEIDEEGLDGEYTDWEDPQDGESDSALERRGLKTAGLIAFGLHEHDKHKLAKETEKAYKQGVKDASKPLERREVKLEELHEPALAARSMLNASTVAAAHAALYALLDSYLPAELTDVAALNRTLANLTTTRAAFLTAENARWDNAAAGYDAFLAASKPTMEPAAYTHLEGRTNAQKAHERREWVLYVTPTLERLEKEAQTAIGAFWEVTREREMQITKRVNRIMGYDFWEPGKDAKRPE
ncbi:hypothetical protein LTR04_004769, partial [Oleoguttula sp. CCFEE 6159]